ncbi:hypothetical protein K6119_11925 [Paracrocinitomix mangrovi]|uniref:hypothetical protein n=1 Tax=Paracrocinitomix mangrovi TaxID=2862509 RepID=UPI001ED9FCF0|nr:hypothetical protein [Paracrocinitomix mangrovi]UKN00440.1 hypothetical protein K6119_11925 [Paracrocinitomix mangrovi]
MMSKRLFILFIALMGFTTMAQEKEAKMVQFNNFSADFEVPQGKTWVIQSIFSSSIGEVVTEADGTKSTLPVRVFIKTLNGEIKTDWQGNRFGPQVFQSDNTAASIAYPITLPEGTKFSLVMITGNPGDCKAFNGSGFMSLYEVTNSSN